MEGLLLLVLLAGIVLAVFENRVYQLIPQRLRGDRRKLRRLAFLLMAVGGGGLLLLNR